MPLSEYRRKRRSGLRSGQSPEPRGRRGRRRRGRNTEPLFVIQHYAAGSEHYDIRLEIDGVLAVRVENGYVTGLYGVRNPEKLSRVERETTVSR